MRRFLTLVRAAGASLTVLLVAALPVVAQAEQLREQTLGRPYWHVFIAYAIALGLILAWVVSIARRLRRVETRLQSRVD